MWDHDLFLVFVILSPEAPYWLQCRNSIYMNNFNYKRQNDKKQTQDVNAQEDAGQTQTTNLPQPIVTKHSLFL